MLTMSNFSDQLEEIKTCLCSITKSNKSLAYSTLLDLQKQASTDNSVIDSLASSSIVILSSIIVDINHDNEEIASLALKCLGFIIYHPSTLAEISGDDANLILDSLVKVITTTKIKSVCNLGVWCISIQQFNASFLVLHLNSLLKAVVHALDNPIGSLSTTYEAIQCLFNKGKNGREAYSEAVMKLTTQLSEVMRDTSNIWAPSIYRRLISTDKREKEMAEKCLVKIWSMLCPPPFVLSQAVALDLKEKLIPAMKELLNGGMKIRALQAWGWYIRLVGTYVVQHRHLVNKMLNIPQQTFSDLDSQVQHATLVAWESLVDALIQPPITTTKDNILQEKSSKENCSETNTDGLSLSRRLKLIMTPLIGILSSKCDISVHSHSLNTWSYLLHKLNTSVNCPLVINTVCLPIFELVFQVGPHNTNILLWNFCLDILDSFALARCEEAKIDFTSPIAGSSQSSECLKKKYPIKWIPWDLSQLDFFIKMVHILISHASIENPTPAVKNLACDAALRVFRSTLKGVQNIFKNSSSTSTEQVLCLSAILTCIKKICEDIHLKKGGFSDMAHIPLHFVEAVTEEFESSILGSSLYSVLLDLTYIDKLILSDEFKNSKIVGPCYKDDTNMVSPIAHLTILYFGVIAKSTEADSVSKGMLTFLRYLLSSYDPLEILNFGMCFLNRSLSFNCLKVWAIIMNCLKDYIGAVKDFKSMFNNSSYLVVCHLLCFPFAVFSCPHQRQRKVDIEHVIQVWKSLYALVLHASRFEHSTSQSFSGNLSSILSEFLDESTTMPASCTGVDAGKDSLFCLYGDVVICVLEETRKLELNCKGSKSDYCSSRGSCRINNGLELAARFMMLILKNSTALLPTGLSITSRFLSTLVRFVRSFHYKEDIISFVEIFTCPLLHWLSCEELQDANTITQLQHLWVQIISSLQTCWPPINFNSSFLDLQATLLEKSLVHPNTSISNPTMNYWNATFGEQINLDYPQTLFPILRKLSSIGKIKLGKKSTATFPVTEPQRYTVTAMVNCGISKRVELVENEGCGSALKRKTCGDLTDHQKEVKRAQQGKTRDCEGRGPGIRTYTSVDFSQGNDDEYSQESQDLTADAILESLKRDGILS